MRAAAVQFAPERLDVDALHEFVAADAADRPALVDDRQRQPCRAGRVEKTLADREHRGRRRERIQPLRERGDAQFRFGRNRAGESSGSGRQRRDGLYCGIHRLDWNAGQAAQDAAQTCPLWPRTIADQYGYSVTTT